MAVFNNDSSSTPRNVLKICSEIVKVQECYSFENDHKEYPTDTRPLETQVAGHTFKEKKHTIGILKHRDGYILKPVNRPIPGAQEIKFYEDMQTAFDPLIIHFKQFIPEYYGTSVLNLDGKEVQFLLLKDVTNGFKQPCVMDVKIGQQTWEPDAPLEKQCREREKYFETKTTMNFCIPGFQVYDVQTKTCCKFGKDYGKALNSEGVYEAFKIFFNSRNGVSTQLITPIIARLKEILNWWKSQRVLHIYSSSVLLAYDASVLHVKSSISANSEDDHNETNSNHCTNSVDYANTDQIDTWLRVSLIDFAHVVPAKNDSPDINYISGLTSFINVLENILHDSTSNEK